MKKQLLYIGLTLLFFSSCSQRLVVSTPSEKHTLKESNTPYYLNDEAEPFSGRFVKRDKDSLLLCKANYNKGNLQGKFLEYETVNDCTFVSLSCKYSKGKLSGSYTKWYKPCKVVLEANYNLAGQLNGKYTEYQNSSDRIKKKLFYNNGILDGENILHHPYGLLEKMVNYKEGKKHDNESTYHWSGVKVSDTACVEGKIHGVAKKWYNNNQLR